jgi:hypothetical protein
MIMGEGHELPADIPDDERGDDRQPDLLERFESPRLTAETLLGRAHRDEQGDERRGDPVIETALDVERPADTHRNRPLGHDRQAERHVGRRQDSGDQRGRTPSGVGDYEISHQRAGRYGKRQPDEQQPLGQALIALDVPQPDCGGIGEQQQRQRQLGDGTDRLAAQREGKSVQYARAEDRASDDEHHRAADPPPVQLRRHERVGQDHDRKSRQTAHQAPLAAPVSSLTLERSYAEYDLSSSGRHRPSPTFA